MNKKSIGALLLSAALLVGASGSTFAYFTDMQKTDTQVITLGNLHVAFQPTSGNEKWDVIGRSLPNFSEAAKVDIVSALDMAFDMGYNELVKTDNTITNVAPGDLLRKSFTLKNTGSLDAKINLSLDDMSVKKGTTTIDNAGTLVGGNQLIKAYTLDAKGAPKEEVKVIVDSNRPGHFVLDARSGESIKVYVVVYLGSEINNAGQDNSINFKVRVDATQWNNPGWNQ